MATPYSVTLTRHQVDDDESRSYTLSLDIFDRVGYQECRESRDDAKGCAEPPLEKFTVSDFTCGNNC